MKLLFIIFKTTTNLLNHDKSLLDRFESIKSVRRKVEENDKISEYLKKRLITPF